MKKNKIIAIIILIILLFILLFPNERFNEYKIMENNNNRVKIEKELKKLKLNKNVDKKTISFLFLKMKKETPKLFSLFMEREALITKDIKKYKGLNLEYKTFLNELIILEEMLLKKDKEKIKKLMNETKNKEIKKYLKLYI